MCDRCGDDDAPAIINFAKSLLTFVHANDSRTLERLSCVTAVVSFVLSWLRTKSRSCKRALSENGLAFRPYGRHILDGESTEPMPPTETSARYCRFALRPPFHPSSAVDRTSTRRWANSWIESRSSRRDS